MKNVIKKFLPRNLSIGTGFVVKKDNYRELQISKQLDIIIYDNTIPVLFLEGDFVILTHKNVKGIIEVKTKIRNNQLGEIIKTTEINGQLIGKNIFNGVFSYENKVNHQTIERVLKEAKGYVNHIVLGPNIFIKFWKKEYKNHLNPPVANCNNDFYNVYKLRGLAFSYFISNLLEFVCSSKLDDRWWFLYPIEETKEKHRMKTICLDRITI